MVYWTIVPFVNSKFSLLINFIELFLKIESKFIPDMAVTRGLLRPSNGEGSIRSFVIIVTLVTMIIFVYYKTQYPAIESDGVEFKSLKARNVMLHGNLKVSSFFNLK